MRIWGGRAIFLSGVVLLVFAFLVFNGTSSARESRHAIQYTTVTATPSPIGFHASPTPTPLAPDPLVAEMLGADQGSPAALRILEYVHENPQTPYRPRLLARVFEMANVDFPLDWLAKHWLDENLIAPLNQNGRVAETTIAEIKNFWRGDFLETDWDNDRVADYFVALRWAYSEMPYPPPSGMYWVHRQGPNFVWRSLPTALNEFTRHAAVKILAARDVNDDGRAEIIYQVSECGRVCDHRLRVLEFQETGYRDLFSLVDWQSNQEWTLSDFADGSVEIIGAELGYPSSGYGTFFPYRAHFRLSDGMFLPAALSPLVPREEWTANGSAMQLAQKLMYARKFQDAQFVLEAVRAQYDPSRLEDYRPYILFRIGFVKLLQNEVKGALETWDELAQQFPDHPTTRHVEFVRGTATKANLIQARDDVWAFCRELQQHHIAWSEWQDRWRIGSNRSETRVAQWYSDCDPTMLLPAWNFTQSEPLATQLIRLGLQFQVLSAAYDLNGDGITDPLGILYFADTRSPWVFLSKGDAYRPLFAA